MSKELEQYNHEKLFNELSALIEQGKQKIAFAANSALTLLFWQIGNRINDEILLNKRADYGRQILPTLSEKLMARYGRSFEEKNLRRMIQFCTQFEDFSIVVPLSRQLSWSHFLILIPLKTTESRLYYAQKAAEEVWGIRELRNQIARKSFERNEIAEIQSIQLPKDLKSTFKDPYILDFLNLKNTYLEHDLERAILHAIL